MQHIKYSFIMPYHKRVDQLRATLESFVQFYRDRTDFEIVIVHDYKSAQDAEESDALMNVVHLFVQFFPITVIHAGSLTGHNPAPLYNAGANVSHGKYLVITNPECMHTTDILSAFDSEFDAVPDSYVMCSCLSSEESYLTVSQALRMRGPWYQHSIKRNIQVHFCAALSALSYMLIGGFSEEYADGMCFEDDDFRNKIKQAGIRMLTRDDLVVIHLKHTRSKPSNYLPLHYINRDIYNAKWGKNAMRAEQFPLKYDAKESPLEY